MNRLTVSLLLLTVAVAGLAMAARAQQSETEPAPECPSERILVKLRPGADPVVVIGRHGGRIVSTIPGIEVQVVAVPAGTATQTIEALNADPEVEYAEPDGVVRAASDDPACGDG